MRVLIRRTIKLKAEAAGFLLFSSIEGFNKEESGPAQPRMIREFSQSKSVGHVRRQPSNKMTRRTHTHKYDERTQVDDDDHVSWLLSRFLTTKSNVPSAESLY